MVLNSVKTILCQQSDYYDSDCSDNEAVSKLSDSVRSGKQSIQKLTRKIDSLYETSTSVVFARKECAIEQAELSNYEPMTKMPLFVTVPEEARSYVGNVHDMFPTARKALARKLGILNWRRHKEL